MVGAFLVHHLEAVDHVAGEILARRETAVLVEPIVVGLERIWDDQMTRAADRNPVRQFVVQRVAVIEETAELEVEATRIGARPAGHPADRAHPGDLLDRLYAEADMLALDLFGHRLV